MSPCLCNNSATESATATFTFLGTGTSTGVPALLCDCPTCTSADEHDKRLRASALVTGACGENVLIDCGPDFRTQLLRHPVKRLDALLITHEHYDHVGGVDDLRPFAYAHDPDGHFPVYCEERVAKGLRHRLPWCFAANPYPGVPTLDIHTLSPGHTLAIGSLPVTPLRVMHASLPILGFRIGSMAYITDCKTMPQSTIQTLAGIDTLVLNALRLEPHMSHLSLTEALEIVRAVNPRQTFLTHIAHTMGPHASVSLPDGVKLAYDGLSFTFHYTPPTPLNNQNPNQSTLQ